MIAYLTLTLSLSLDAAESYLEFYDVGFNTLTVYLCSNTSCQALHLKRRPKSIVISLFLAAFVA